MPDCRLCPRQCGADRAVSAGVCHMGSAVRVARAAPHYGEEPCISGERGSGAVFFAAGVFYYFLTPQVKALVCAMAEAFPGGKLVFDAANRKAVKLMLKTWLKDAEIKDVGAYFAVTGARRELSAWSDRLRVSSRGYMLGYNDLRNQNVRKFFRFLSKVGDGMMNMQIVRLDFAKENKKHE